MYFEEQTLLTSPSMQLVALKSSSVFVELSVAPTYKDVLGDGCWLRVLVVDVGWWWVSGGGFEGGWW